MNKQTVSDRIAKATLFMYFFIICGAISVVGLLIGLVYNIIQLARLGLTDAIWPAIWPLLLAIALVCISVAATTFIFSSIIELYENANTISTADDTATDNKSSANSVVCSKHYIDDNCIQCGACAANCPVSAIEENNGKYSVDTKKCIGCGVCESCCSKNAIKPMD